MAEEWIYWPRVFGGGREVKSRRNYATKLTHGDFNSQNIIIRDKKVTGIID